MHLHRVTPDPFQNYPVGGKFLGTSSHKFKVSTFRLDGELPTQVVVTRFDRFGGGEKRYSDFEVILDWADFEKILEKFCEADHPEALALCEARKLGKAVADFCQTIGPLQSVS